MRDTQEQLDTFASSVAYLSRYPRGLAAGSNWPCDLRSDLSREFRALKTWFTIVVHGTDKLGTAIFANCALARYFAQRLGHCAELAPLAPVALNIVCFRVRCAKADRANAEIVCRSVSAMHCRTHA